MSIDLSPVRQVAIAYYTYSNCEYIRSSNLNREGIIRECSSKIDECRDIPRDSEQRVIARAVRPLDSTQYSSLLQELGSFLEEASLDDEMNSLFVLIDEATSALKSACPNEFRSSSTEERFNDISINTFEFIELVIYGGVGDTLTLKNALPEALIKSVDQRFNHMEAIYRGLKQKRWTSEQLRLLENPDLFCAAKDGFLKLEKADELIDFAYVIRNLRYLIIMEQWKKKDSEVKKILEGVIEKTIEIARTNLLEKSYGEEKDESKKRNDLGYAEEFRGRAMINLNYVLSDIQFDKKIDFGNTLSRHLFLIAESLPDIDSTNSQILAS